MRPLTGPELESARDALVSGFYDWAQLNQLAAFVLDINLEAEVGRGPLKQVAFDLLKLTEAHSWTELLLRDALARRPGNPNLLLVARQHGLAPAPFSRTKPGAGGPAGGFEVSLFKQSGLGSTGAWRKLMARCEQKVCQILLGKAAIGTGFLVARDLVMSNWHVFEAPAYSGKLGPPGDYTARFDFRAAEEGDVAHPGLEVPFRAGVQYRDHSHKLELDYVLVELSRSVGDEAMPDGEKRGWLALGTREFEVNETTFVLQHPARRTLEMAPGTIVGWVPEKRGQIYEHLAETDEGSSGSPCFSPTWTLLGIHHRADPVTHDRNRAIATTAILGRMAAVNTIAQLPSI